MTDRELLECLKDRPCEACKFHSNKGCSKWDCVFDSKRTMAIKALEREPCEEAYNQGYEDGYLAGQKNIAERFEGLIKSGISTDTPDDIKYVIGLLNELPSVNLQVSCDDAISRQIISDYVESHIQEINTGYGDLNKHTNKILRMIVDYIEGMPSVNPQEPCKDCCNGNQIEKAKLCQKSYLAGMEHKQEPKTGHWKNNKCDVCGASRPPLFDNFCPNCGCAMVEPQESEGQE